MRTATPGRIDVAFSGRRARFPLNAQFSIPAKRVTGIFGPPGCGKTTVARCIAGLERLSTGFCVIDGEVWQDETTFRAPHLRPIGYVFKESGLFPHLSVRRNLLYAARKRQRRPIAFDEVTELLAIASLLERSPAHLSAGERQRVAIGRALLSQPKILLMDEPLATLDRCAKRGILPCLKRLNEKLAVPTIYISHDMAEIEYLADHLVMMERGAITAAGPLHTLQSDPELPLAAGHEAAISLDAVVGGYDGRYGLLILRLKGARLLVPAAPLAPACTSGCASQPATSASRAKRRAQAPSSMSFRRGLKLVFRSARPRSLWFSRLAPAAQVRTFWRASRVTRLIRYGSRTEGTCSPSSSTSRWSRPLKRHRKPQSPPHQQGMPDRQASLLKLASKRSRCCISINAMEAGCCFKGTPKRAYHDHFPGALDTGVRRIPSKAASCRVGQSTNAKWLDELRLREFHEGGSVIKLVQMVQGLDVHVR